MIEIKLCECDLREMHWSIVTDWGRLCPSKITILGDEYLTKEDILRFYDMIVKDIARKMVQDYKTVKEIIDAENTPFIEYLCKIFEKKKYYSKEAYQIKQLKKMLIAPQKDANLKNMIRLYNALPVEQKKEFKKYIMEE